MRKQLPGRGDVDYQVERHNEVWADHQARTLVTGALLAWLKPVSVLDPACGDGSIVRAGNMLHQFVDVTLGDISVPNIENVKRGDNAWALVVGDVDDNIKAHPGGDAIVLTEILEHIDDPDATLRRARAKFTWLVASSPEMRKGQTDNNPEHRWMFDHDGYRSMLIDAGWTPVQYTLLRFETEYDFGIWVCR